MHLTSLLAPPIPPSSLTLAMADVLHEAAQRAVLPRFGRLLDDDIGEKTPGELVTVADLEAERIIAAGLAAIRPKARFIGEEACARDPALLRGLDEGEAWIVDPIDGTGNFASGAVPFAMMAAYLRCGELAAACILDPLTGVMIMAERGAGAWCNGERIVTSQALRPLWRARGIVSHFQRPPAMEGCIAALAERTLELLPTRRCAGAEYPLVAAGALDFALYWRTLVWDHAPGVLIIEEAGGKAARLDGARYRPADAGGPILIAHTPEIWAQAAGVLSR